MLCSCVSGPRVAKPVKLQSYKNYQTPEKLSGDSSEKKTR